MKKRLIVTILIILIYMIFVSCNSCTSSSAQSAVSDSSLCYQDTLRSTTENDTLIMVFAHEADLDEQKVPVIKKEIKPIVIDTLQKIRVRRDSTYKKLQKTEVEIKEQQKKIDSLLIVRKK